MRYLILFLTAAAIAQTPAPKTAAEADHQYAQMLGQKQALYMQLEADPTFLQYEKMQQSIDAMKETRRQLVAAEAQAQRDKAAADKTAKAKADAAKAKK